MSDKHDFDEIMNQLQEIWDDYSGQEREIKELEDALDECSEEFNANVQDVDAWRMVVAELLGVPMVLIETPDDVRRLMVR